MSWYNTTIPYTVYTRVIFFHITYKILISSDSLYMALSANSLDDLIKPELKEEWIATKKLWFPRDDTEENKAYDKRTPGKHKTNTDIDVYFKYIF